VKISENNDEIIVTKNGVNVNSRNQRGLAMTEWSENGFGDGWRLPGGQKQSQMGSGGGYPGGHGKAQMDTDGHRITQINSEDGHR